MKKSCFCWPHCENPLPLHRQKEKLGTKAQRWQSRESGGDIPATRTANTSVEEIRSERQRTIGQFFYHIGFGKGIQIQVSKRLLFRSQVFVRSPPPFFLENPFYILYIPPKKGSTTHKHKKLQKVSIGKNLGRHKVRCRTDGKSLAKEIQLSINVLIINLI